MEMTASYQQLLSLAIAAMVAFVIAELRATAKPIYEELMQRMLRKKHRKPAVLEQRNVIELAVCSGSSVSGKLIKDAWPPNTLLVDVKRGESQLIPAGDTRLFQRRFHLYPYCYRARGRAYKNGRRIIIYRT